jgi:hypothetical protein
MGHTASNLQLLTSPSHDSPQHRQTPSNDYDQWLSSTSSLPREDSNDYIAEDLLGSSDLIQSQDFASPSSSSFGSGFNIEDILNEEPTLEDMASRRTRHSVVDLTSSPSSSTSRRAMGVKRTAEGEAKPRTAKRRKVVKSEDSDFEKENKQEIEELDLTNEAPNAEEELLQTQQQQMLATQEATSNGPQRIGKRTCIICMESFTNATVTSCGHMYCHECLIQALLVGERNSDKGVGNCPVCRKAVNRKKPTALIPIAFMKRSTFKGKKRRDLNMLG